MEYTWFPMPDDLYEELWWWWNNRPVKNSAYVFVSTSNFRYGKPFISRHQFMKALCKRAGVSPHFGFHALRNYFASILADSKKASTKTIQRLLRHKSYHTTEKYIRQLNQDLKSSLDVVGESLKHKIQEKEHQEGAPKEERASDEDH
jgi:integrase